jgi:hypothetical protein
MSSPFTRTVTKHGKPGWLCPDGRVIPVIAGASDAPPVTEGAPQGEPPAAQEPPAPASEPGITIPIESVPPQDQPPVDPDRIFTTADIEKARREEKDKLYSRIESMDAEVKRLREEREAREAAEAEARRQAEEEARRAAEEEMSVRELLQAKEQEWNSRLAEIEAQREEERRVFEMERQFQQLEQYRLQAIQANEDGIMPELRDLITGNTQEEIDASIALAMDKTARILANMTAAQQQVRQTQRSASVTAPAAGPMENETNYQTLTADDIRNMDMDTYRQNREKILGALGSQNRSQGLYG